MKKFENTPLPELPCAGNEWFKQMTPAAIKDIRAAQQAYYDALVGYYYAAEVGQTVPVVMEEYKRQEESLIKKFQAMVLAYEDHGINTLDEDTYALQQQAKKIARQTVQTETIIGDFGAAGSGDASGPGTAHRDRLHKKRLPSSFLTPPG